MRTTVDLPDELYRRAKAEAAVGNFNDLVEGGLQHVLRGPSPETPAERPAGPSVYDLMRDYYGIAKDSRPPIMRRTRNTGRGNTGVSALRNQKRQLRKIPNSSPPTASVDGDPAGPIGKGGMSRPRFF